MEGVGAESRTLKESADRNVLLVAPPLNFEATYPLSLAGVAGPLVAAGARVVGLDLRLNPDGLGRLSGIKDRIGLVVVDSSIRNAAEVRRVIERLRASLHARIVVSGTAAALHPRRFLGPGLADAVITGDPEDVVPRLLNDWPTLPVAGVAALSGEGELVSMEPEFIPGSDLPAPDREVFPLSDYSGHPLRRGPARAAIEASRGCPFDCPHCPTPARYRGTHRARAPEAVVDEMARLRRDHDVMSFLFEDEQPLADRQWLWALLALIRRRLPGVDLFFPNGLRPDLLDPEVIRELSSSGTRRVALGIESASEGTRAALGRPVEDGHLDLLVREMNHRGIITTGYFMLGIPGETMADAVATVLGARRLSLHYVHFSVFWPWRELLWVPTRRMRVASACRRVAYLSTYLDPGRLGRLLARGEVAPSRFPAAAGRFWKWFTTGVKGGGGW